MPVIGLIDIPDNLWDALIEIAAKDFAEMTFDIARRELAIDLQEASILLQIQENEEKIPHLHNCVATLVRIQTGDYLSDDETIQNSDNYLEILRAARNIGDQIAYSALSSGTHLKGLKALVDSHWKDMNTELPSP